LYEEFDEILGTRQNVKPTDLASSTGLQQMFRAKKHSNTNAADERRDSPASEAFAARSTMVEPLLNNVSAETT
jgi:hypothetical protein